MCGPADTSQTLTWILFALTGIFVSASTKSVFVPTLCVADIASDDQRTRFYSRLEAVSLLGPGTAYSMLFICTLNFRLPCKGWTTPTRLCAHNQITHAGRRERQGSTLTPR